MKYWDIMDREEKGTFITFESDYEAQKWLKNHSQRNEGLHIVERDRQTIKIVTACKTALEAIGGGQ